MFTSDVRSLRERQMFEKIKQSTQEIMMTYLKKAVVFNDVPLVKTILCEISIPESDLSDYICEAAYYANIQTLQILLQRCKSFIYRPEEKSAKLQEWLENNIKKGQNGEVVGWTMGADSGPWPSTNLEDYIKVLNMLNDRKMC